MSSGMFLIDPPSLRDISPASLGRDYRRGTWSRPPIIRRVANSAAPAGSTGSRATMTIEISKATPAIEAAR